MCLTIFEYAIDLPLGKVTKIKSSELCLDKSQSGTSFVLQE